MDIRDAAQFEKAKLEDMLVEVLYSKYADLVLHSGTAIWRCYKGNRFSRDLDFYMKTKNNGEGMLRYREVPKFLQGYGFTIKEKGYSSATGTMHFVVELAKAKMKVDINFRYKDGTPADYVKVDDSRIVVLSLTPLQLLGEKIEAYSDKFDNEGDFKHPEAHDLYDMWYLVSIIEKPDPRTVKGLGTLLGRIENSPPEDLGSLGHLVLAGLPPSFNLMVGRLRAWVHDNS